MSQTPLQENEELRRENAALRRACELAREYLRGFDTLEGCLAGEVALDAALAAVGMPVEEK